MKEMYFCKGEKTFTKTEKRPLLSEHQSASTNCGFVFES